MQRACVCGGMSGPSGECAECRQKRLTGQPAVQPKLTVNQPGDRYEQEADRVADTIMRMAAPQVQRQSMQDETLHIKSLAAQISPLVQRQVDLEEEEEQLQAKAASAQTPQVSQTLATELQTLRGGGQPLDPAMRAFMEPRFGHDFSQVRVHTDGKAAEMAKETNARAFTIGHDIAFQTGEYAPNTQKGQRLLAHELTHTIQQRQWEHAPQKIQREDDTEEEWQKDKDGTLYYKTKKEAETRMENLKAEGKWRELRVTEFERNKTKFWRVEMRGAQTPKTEEEGQDAPAKEGPSCPVVAEGTLSEVSWGETSGIYPTSKNKYDPSKWDDAKTCEILKMRRAVHEVGQRGESVHRGKPKSGDAIEQKLKPYHLIENFPEADPEIKDAGVKWFYLSANSNTPAKHPGLTQDNKIVKTYGSFYNIGGGDVPKGDVWIHFYKLKS